MRIRRGRTPTVRPDVRVRPAELGDAGFIRHVRTLARLQSFRGPAKSADEISALVAMQLRAADRWRAAKHPLAVTYVIQDEEEPVGVLVLEATPQTLHVLDLVLLPQCRGSGIGTTVMLGVCQVADERGLPVALDVPREHRVISFLRHLRFQEVGGSTTSLSLRRQGSEAATTDDETAATA